MSNVNPNKAFGDAKKQKLQEALQILEDAARDTKDDFKTILKDRYSNLKDEFRELADDIGLDDQVERITKRASKFYKQSKQAARDSVATIDNSVRDNPWTYIASSLAAGFLVGFLVGRRD